MAFDLEKFKHSLSTNKLKKMFAKDGADGVPVWALASRNSKLVEFKNGLQDIKNVLAEGKYVLFVKQFVLSLFFLNPNGDNWSHVAQLSTYGKKRPISSITTLKSRISDKTKACN